MFPLKNLEAHNSREKHRKVLIELPEQSTESKTSNGEESVHIQNSKRKVRDNTDAKDHGSKRKLEKHQEAST